MTAAVSNAAKATSLANRVRQMPAWAWWLLALAAIAVNTWIKTGTGMGGYLGDSDDATRLIQVREFLGGALWFDTTTLTMGGHAGRLTF